MTTIVAPPWEEQPTGGGIVAASALPLPDVWAPLSDSLRMITGYGREVKVGEDVVSQMVNFSRSTTATYIGKDGLLKTAAANEPRFEKEGLLIEGQSTNVFNWVFGANFSWMSVELTQSAGTVPLPFDVFQKTITSSTANPTNTGRVLVDLYGTANPAASGGGPVTASAIMFGDADAIIAAAPGMNITSNLPITNITYSAVKLNSGMVRVMWTGIITAGSAANFINFQLDWLDRLPSVVAGCFQVEALPFASSYIPTNGAAVTRAMDKPLMPVKMNEATKVQTCAIEINIPLVNISVYRWILQGSYVSLSITNSGHIRGWDFAATVGAGLTREGRSVIAQRITDASRSVFNNGVGFTVSNTGVTGGYFPYTTSDLAIGWHAGTYALYGHVRNLRIWHRDLGDTQIKAIA